MTVRSQLKRYIEDHPELSQRQIAIALDMAPQYLSALLNEGSDTVPLKLAQVIDHLGLELQLVEKGSQPILRAPIRAPNE